MKILTICGSPRKKGNSAILAGIVTAVLAERGHDIVTHYLNGLSYKGCQACGGCKGKSEVCILKDDLTPVLNDIHEADVVIMATPVYWGEISSQMKGFIDRTYSFLTPGFMTEEKKHRLPAGKKLVFIQTQGAGNDMYNDIFPRYNGFFEQLNIFEETYLIRGCDINDKGAVNERSDLLEKAHKTAQNIMKK
jgi:multimeric flavodoxin WrbA